MDMRQLDINQCPSDYHTPNAFKNTHKCDPKTSYVSKKIKSLKSILKLCHFSAFQFSVVGLKVAAISASAFKDTSIHLRISSPTTMVSWSSQNSRIS